ncbi:MAG: AEC family transporter [Eubacteriales bacterium]|nr:AEC family transporter [Eubacteriales bacterium]
MILLQQMIAFMVFMMIGYYIRKKGILDDKGSTGVAWIVANLANPALILSGAVNAEQQLSAKEIGSMMALAILLYAILIILSFLIPFLLKVPQHQLGIYRNMILFSNVGFMGYPLLNSLKGPFSVLCASIFVIMFNVTFYTLGIWNFKRDHSDGTKTRFRDLLNTGTIACIVSLIINLSGVEINGAPRSVITNLANLTTALSMMSIGMFMIQVDFTTIWKDVRMLIFTAVKLLIIPMAVISFFHLFVKDHILMAVLTIFLATPVASITAIMEKQYSDDNLLSTKAVTLTTVISVITIPLIYELMN